ncbi:Hypothetical predicted protein, partial [Paramuricea clavata]
CSGHKTTSLPFPTELAKRIGNDKSFETILIETAKAVDQYKVKDLRIGTICRHSTMDEELFLNQCTSTNVNKQKDAAILREQYELGKVIVNIINKVIASCSGHKTTSLPFPTELAKQIGDDKSFETILIETAKAVDQYKVKDLRIGTICRHSTMDEELFLNQCTSTNVNKQKDAAILREQYELGWGSQQSQQSQRGRPLDLLSELNKLKDDVGSLKRSIKDIASSQL